MGRTVESVLSRQLATVTAMDQVIAEFLAAM